jgi:hypothetical protein
MEPNVRLLKSSSGLGANAHAVVMTTSELDS